jgi:hypothetical protein
MIVTPLGIGREEEVHLRKMRLAQKMRADSAEESQRDQMMTTRDMKKVPSKTAGEAEETHQGRMRQKRNSNSCNWKKKT